MHEKRKIANESYYKENSEHCQAFISPAVALQSKPKLMILKIKTYKAMRFQSKYRLCSPYHRNFIVFNYDSIVLPLLFCILYYIHIRTSQTMYIMKTKMFYILFENKNKKNK